MKSNNELRTMLRAIDRKSYPAYKSLAGAYQFGTYVLVIDHVQGDPFASPSSVHVEVAMRDTGFPPALTASDPGRIALQDHLTRLFAKEVEAYNFKARGSGKSGLISITRCGQEVLERSACQIVGGRLTVRFHVGFPAFGRTIDAGGLEKILFDFLPKCVNASFFYRNINQKRATEAVWLAEDQQALRELLRREHLTAFVADGAILPRKSGVSDLPMKESVPFASPDSMRRTFSLPHRGEITGMAVPEGITLIVGGGYHGKSTLLSALQMGVYNHIVGDGREFVITDDTAVKLRAEEGRFIRRMDISMFINDLPNRKDTRSFSTLDASGSTSQAAGVMEGLEADSRLFLIDEDTSATNFMVRDDLMQQVISREKEPITPFLERARDLYEKAGVSTILVAGSSGAFFYIADRVIQMDCYRPVDITGRVRAMCEKIRAPRIQAPGFTVPDFAWGYAAKKAAAAKQADAGQDGEGGRAQSRDGGRGDHRGGHDRGAKVKTFGQDSFSIDRENVELRYVEQLADSEQTQALAYLLRYALEHVIDGRRTVRQVVRVLSDTLRQKGWEPFCQSYVPCGLAKPREQEIFACLNRYRG
ncbi:MAG: ABC-ATPase domain-containing protein [Clostridiales bacterium]|nr:ABC-ATPase domain-containing protein [Clostridiales bacterium]